MDNYENDECRRKSEFLVGPINNMLIMLTMMTVTTMMMMTMRKQAWGGFAGHTASGLAFLLLGNWLVG